MHVYRNQRNITIHIQPGVEYPETSEFMEKGADKSTPLMISVPFIEFKASVSQAVGRYMLDKKLAYKSIAEARDAEPVIQVA